MYVAVSTLNLQKLISTDISDISGYPISRMVSEHLSFRYPTKSDRWVS